MTTQDDYDEAYRKTQWPSGGSAVGWVLTHVFAFLLGVGGSILAESLKAYSQQIQQIFIVCLLVFLIGALALLGAHLRILTHLGTLTHKGFLRIAQPYVEYHAATNDAASKEKLYNAIEVALESAKRRIVAFTTYSSEVEAMADDRREKYFESLQDFIERNPKVQYTRILQVNVREPVEVNPLHQEFSCWRENDNYWKHFAWIFGCNLGNVEFKLARARRPSTFLLIDESKLVWQINQLRDDGTAHEMIGVFIITAPDSQIIRAFADYVEALRENDSLFKCEVAGNAAQTNVKDGRIELQFQ